ncbi:MAG: sigma-70 family RNA polymerase sigma factor [Lentisphaeria bacterium]|nr:sigma-70 family RNA polymerase sigma factor [Lentisphaeria bacterium]
MQRVQAGNERAWNEFYRRYAGMIYYIGKKKHLSPEECDDLMIDVMMIFWKKIDAFLYDSERGNFRSYLSRISELAALKIVRQKNKQISAGDVSEASLEYPEDVDDACMREWQDFIIEKALLELQNHVDTETFQAFHMSFIQRRSIDDVAAVTRKSRNNIYVIRNRCIKKLKEIITVFRQCEEHELRSHSQRKASAH